MVPPQTAPDFIVNSGLQAPSGFVDVNPSTLRHNKAANIFSLGDVANLPTGKTAAGVFSQVPIVVNNLLRSMDHKYLNGSYNGY